MGNSQFFSKFNNFNMGNLCSGILINENEINFSKEKYKDIYLKSYSSSHDSYFKAFEKKHNILRFIPLAEFSILFNNFRFDLSKNNIFRRELLFTEEVDKKGFMTFFKLKVENNHLIYQLKEDTISKQVFSDFISKIFDLTSKGLVSYLKQTNNNENNVKEKKKLKKYFFTVIGILFCSSDNLTKLDYIFESFCNDTSCKLEADNAFKIFLFMLILTSSYGGIKTIHDICESYPADLPILTESDITNILEVYNVKSIITIRDELIHSLFESEDNTLSYYEYKDKIINDGVDWFLSPAGIRWKLESLNR